MPTITVSKFYKVLANIDTKAIFISCFNAKESRFCLAREGRKIANLTGLKYKSFMCKGTGLSPGVVPLLNLS